MTMDTRDPNTNISDLKAKPTIEEWRAKKDELDEANDHVAILGCVGAPLAAWFDSYAPYGALGPDAAKELIEACIDARVNLLDMLNDHRERAYEQACQDIADYAEYCEVSACIEEVNGSTTLEEVAEAGRDAVHTAISNFGSGGLSDLTLEDMS